jgi:hypothetical protein
MNQHSSPRRTLLDILDLALFHLRMGDWLEAQMGLFQFRARYNDVPESTRRRWRCGK